MECLKLNYTQYEEKTKEIIFEKYIVEDNNIYILIKKNNSYCMIFVSSYIKVFAKEVSVSDYKFRYVLEFFNGKKVVKADFDGSILTKNKIVDLFSYGVVFNEEMAKYLLEFLRYSARTADLYYIYSSTGWHSISQSNKLCFMLDRAYSGDGAEVGYLYKGCMDLLPKGSYKVWEDMVRTEVMGNTPLEFILLLGFASPVLAFLNKTQDIGSIVFNLTNLSSKGKTTSAMLATSVFSNPEPHKGTLITFNATENALSDYISGCNGLTVAIDEAAISENSKNKELWYSICLGSSKMRLNGDSTQKPVKKYSSVIISTSEFSFIDDDTPDGIRVRVFEIKGNLTTSAQSSSKIKETVKCNYGVAAPRFLDSLIKNIYDIETDYNFWYKDLLKKATNKSQYTERILSKLAIILVVADCINNSDSFDFNFNISMITEYILSLCESVTHTRTAEIDLYKKIVKEYENNDVSCNYETSEKNACDYISKSNLYGKIVKEKNYLLIYIKEARLSELADNYKNLELKRILSRMKQQGLLLSERDRLYTRIVINKTKEKCYAFIVSTSQNK